MMVAILRLLSLVVDVAAAAVVVVVVVVVVEHSFSNLVLPLLLLPLHWPSNSLSSHRRPVGSNHLQAEGSSP